MNFFWIGAFVADTAAVNPNGIKTLLANGVSTFFIKGKSVFGNGPESLSRNPSNCIIFYNLMLTNTKILTFLWNMSIIVSNDLCGKSVSESSIMFYYNHKVILVWFFIVDFNYQVEN